MHCTFHSITTNDIFASLRLAYLMQCLEKIDPKIGLAVKLHYAEGLGIEETATLLKVSSTTVKSRAGQGLAWLQGHWDTMPRSRGETRNI
jgi:DNA-directed RNA polymerase specialized sigma24 family protein